MKIYYLSILTIVLFVSGCQTKPPIPDSTSIQSTAVAMAWTSVAQTQAVDVVSTVNAQGTQIAILSQPTVAITPTQNLLMTEDNEIKLALVATLGLNESDFFYNTSYNDGQVAIGDYFLVGSLDSNGLPSNNFWFAQRDGNGQWGIIDLGQGRPSCDKVRSFNIQFPVLCLDANGNEIMYQFP